MQLTLQDSNSGTLWDPLHQTCKW